MPLLDAGRTPARCLLAATACLIAMAALSACSPTFNWRELRPQGTPLQSAFQRMRTAREQEARTITAQGQKNAQIIRAEADASASRTYANSFGKDASFYEFYRAMQSYRQTFGEKYFDIFVRDYNFFAQDQWRANLAFARKWRPQPATPSGAMHRRMESLPCRAGGGDLSAASCAALHVNAG